MSMDDFEGRTAEDTKYGEVLLERCRTPFAEHEPVFVFRAQDELAVELLTAYRDRCIFEGCGEVHIDAIDESIRRFVAWQLENGHKVKMPDTDSEQWSPRV
jgi:hypothetical protein